MPDHVDVFFAQGEQLIPVARRAGTVEGALAALLRGPMKAEAAKGMKTYLRADTALRSVAVERGIATVDLGARLTSGADQDVLGARLAQVVSTAAAVPGVKGVRLRANGATVSLPGLPADRPLTPAALARPSAPFPELRELAATASPSPATRALQQRLADLGFLRPGGVDGLSGPETRFAIIAFQKWARLPRDGVATAATRQRLGEAARPRPRSGGRGRRIEVLLDRQLALLIDGPRVVRTIHVSTGGPRTRTPAGSYSVFRKERRSWSVPFRVWLPWASYFVGGIAFHEYPDVPVQPASHGCVRVPRYDAPTVYEFCPRGTPVKVLTSS